MKILIVRPSSLGDMVHCLPALYDIRAAVPDARFDWVSEPAFAEIPTWAEGVDHVLIAAHRRWRKSWFKADTRRERAAFKRDLQSRSYDLVLDLHGMLKTAWITRLARGEKHGFDRHSTKEFMATWVYDRKHPVSYQLDNISRYRLLAAQSVGYEVDLYSPLHYGIRPELQRGNMVAMPTHIEGLPEGDEPFVTAVVSASTDKKCWRVDYWQQLFRHFADRGLKVCIFSGNAQEFQRGQALAEGLDHVVVLPRMELTATAQLIARSQLMVGLDSGLTHLAAALDRPTIGIYCSTPVLVAPVRTPSAFSAQFGDVGQPPEAAEVLHAIEEAGL